VHVPTIYILIMHHVNFASPFVLFFLVIQLLFVVLPDYIALRVPAKSKYREVTHNNDLMRKDRGGEADRRTTPGQIPGTPGVLSC